MIASTRTWVAAALLALLSVLSPAQASLLVLSYHDIRDDVAPKGDPDPYAAVSYTHLTLPTILRV